MKTLAFYISQASLVAIHRSRGDGRLGWPGQVWKRKISFWVNFESLFLLRYYVTNGKKVNPIFQVHAQLHSAPTANAQSMTVLPDVSTPVSTDMVFALPIDIDVLNSARVFFYLLQQIYVPPDIFWQIFFISIAFHKFAHHYHPVDNLYNHDYFERWIGIIVMQDSARSDL